jgi:hypothetical protein
MHNKQETILAIENTLIVLGMLILALITIIALN